MYRPENWEQIVRRSSYGWNNRDALEAGATSDKPFTPEEIDRFIEETKPILVERGILKDE